MTLRGLPFTSGEKEIVDFLQPLQAASIEVIYNRRGQHSGKALVTLDSEDTMQEVLKKDKQYIGGRGCVFACACAGSYMCVSGDLVCLYWWHRVCACGQLCCCCGCCAIKLCTCTSTLIVGDRYIEVYLTNQPPRGPSEWRRGGVGMGMG